MTDVTERLRTVYFIKPIGMQGPVKIGCSISPDGRRKTLETWSPFPLEIIAEIGGSMNDEWRFHAHFRDTYQGREWFGWSARMADIVERINAGTFDMAELPAPECLVSKHRERRPWSEDAKLRASYSRRIRRAEARTGKNFPHYIQHVRCRGTWRQLIPQIEAFLKKANAA